MIVEAQRIIEERSMPVPFSGCWLWLLSTRVTGYGQLTYRGENWLAHRLSYAAFKGELAKGQLVQHSCDEPLCVNPDHLSLGTDATNNKDKQFKGRAARLLDAEKVLAIRNSPLSDKDTAWVMEVSVSMIRKVRLRENWDHIPGAPVYRNPRKLTLVGACIARHMKRRGERVADIAHAFGTTEGYMQHVLAGRAWTDWNQLFLEPTETKEAA